MCVCVLLPDGICSSQPQAMLLLVLFASVAGTKFECQLISFFQSAAMHGELSALVWLHETHNLDIDFFDSRSHKYLTHPIHYSMLKALEKKHYNVVEWLVYTYNSDHLRKVMISSAWYTPFVASCRQNNIYLSNLLYNHHIQSNGSTTAECLEMAMNNDAMLTIHWVSSTFQLRKDWI